MNVLQSFSARSRRRSQAMRVEITLRIYKIDQFYA
jgi:hypothetical protein